MPPSEFIPHRRAVEPDRQIGEWTIAAGLPPAGDLPEHLTVAVNLSARHFRLADIAAIVTRALREAGVAPHRLEIEITESLLIENPEEMALQAAGV